MHIHSQLIRAQLENRSSDPSNPKDGMTYFNTSIGKQKTYNETSGTWAINQASDDYIANSGAESSTSGWAEYADAAAATPADGIGGAPTVALTRDIASPLRGGASFLLTKDAADRQGEGVAYDFSIDSADQSQQLSLKFDYSVGGGFVTGGSSDVMMFIYDVTNASLIALSSATIDNASGRFDATFVAAANSTSYRLIFHVATVNAAAWTIKFDSVSVSPNISVSPTFSALPAGMVIDYAGSAAPSGYLLCDGSAVSRATYATLFGVVGTDYGVGDGATTFNVPDLRGRVAVGRDNMGTNFPADLTYHANMLANSAAPQLGSGSVVVTAPAVIASNEIQVPANASAKWEIPVGLSDLNITDEGSLRFEWIPGYTGQPFSEAAIVEISGASGNSMQFLANAAATGFRFNLTANGVAVVPDLSFGSFSAVSGTPVEVEIGWDLANTTVVIYIDGVRVYNNTSTAASTWAAWIGSSVLRGISNGGFEAADYDNISYFDVIQHTGVSYTPGSLEFGANDAGRVTTAESGIDGAVLGGAGGAESHALTVPELAEHNHIGTTDGDGDHTHGINGNLSSTLLTLSTAPGGTGPFYLNGGSQDVSIQNAGTHTHTFTTNNNGSGDTHQNMPPSLILNKIIKT
jgi:microcystin-dependent protein